MSGIADVESDRKGPALRKLYYSIGEVSELTGVPPHVLRYWENEFPQLRPKKSRTGNRVYQDKELETVYRIKSLLYERRFTIAGARTQLRADDGTEEGNGLIEEVRRELKEILGLLDKNSGRGAAR
jgi:DNA-binding transcriptional MerR regulator